MVNVGVFSPAALRLRFVVSNPSMTLGSGRRQSVRYQSIISTSSFHGQYPGFKRLPISIMISSSDLHS